MWCNQHQLQRSGRTALDIAREKGHDEVVKILENAESWLHKCVNESRSFVSESEASSKTQLQPQILIVPLLYLRHEAPRFARGATQLLVRSLD